MPKTIKHITSPSVFLMYTLAGILLTALALSSCSTIATSVVSTQSFRIEDRAWMTDSLRGYVFLPNSRVVARMQHDDDSIYIEIRTPDTLTLRSMLINGLSVWVDPEGEQNEKYGVAFPAARAEMMRQQEEIMQQMREEGDTSQRQFVLRHEDWVEAVARREAVLTDVKGTRFVRSAQARIFMENDLMLAYSISMSFSQLGIEESKPDKISVGIISELHQAQLLTSGQTQQTATDRYGRPTRQQAPVRERPQRIQLIPIKGWVNFIFNEELPKEN